MIYYYVVRRVVLGLLPTANQNEINKAWRRLVLLHHPDKFRQTSSVYSPTSSPSATPLSYSQSDGKENLDIRIINEAKWVLGDTNRRKAYDARLELGVGDGAEEATSTPSGPHITTWFSLSDFTPHYRSTVQVQDGGDHTSHRYSSALVDDGSFTPHRHTLDPTQINSNNNQLESTIREQGEKSKLSQQIVGQSQSQSQSQEQEQGGEEQEHGEEEEEEE
ncbi:hypothetical protein BCR39DRAFT_594743, partial [Naematelia encephala]